MKYIFLLVLCVCFGIIHSLLISNNTTNWLQNQLGRYFAFYRLVYNLIAMIIFIPLFVYTKNLDLKVLINWIPPWDILQDILSVGSVIIIIVAFFKYDYLEFLGIRQIINFYSNNYEPKAPHRQLVRTGFLGVVRHPMYLATIVFLWSQSITLAEILVSLVLTLYIVVGTFLEERKLVSEYGQAYIQYQRDVPMLLPFLKRRSSLKSSPIRR